VCTQPTVDTLRSLLPDVESDQQILPQFSTDEYQQTAIRIYAPFQVRGNMWPRREGPPSHLNGEVTEYLDLCNRNRWTSRGGTHPATSISRFTTLSFLIGKYEIDGVWWHRKFEFNFNSTLCTVPPSYFSVFHLRTVSLVTITQRSRHLRMSNEYEALVKLYEQGEKRSAQKKESPSVTLSTHHKSHTNSPGTTRWADCV
jgi:hypothetical protein